MNQAQKNPQGWSGTPAYDPDNIFAKILAGQVPCFKIYEDERTFAFLDIMPRADGHTLVIPKAKARNIFDCPAEDLKALIATTQQIAVAARKAFHADGLALMQYNEAAGGQEVFHLHFHVIPRRAGEPLRPPGQMADKNLLARHAELIRNALSWG